MKYLMTLLTIVVLTCGIWGQDSLSAGEKQVLILLGSVFSEAKHKIIEDSRTNGDKSILGTFATSAFKLSGGKKWYRKIDKEFKKSGSSPLNMMSRHSCQKWL